MELIKKHNTASENPYFFNDRSRIPFWMLVASEMGQDLWRDPTKAGTGLQLIVGRRHDWC
jgi:hypothetical protein